MEPLDEEELRSIRRRRDLDGVVHQTYTLSYRSISTAKRVFMRVFMCSSGVVKTSGEELRGYTIESVDVLDEPAPVTCFGCLAEL